ncbi:MAG: proteasome assembly chaperone family protein [Candidatus Aenigmatarchaeota archaeon]
MNAFAETISGGIGYMKTEIKILKKLPKMKNPILIEGLPGVGNVGRVCAGYLISELKAEKFAELVSPHFLPLVVLDSNSVTHVLKNEFYYCKSKKQSLIILTGDSQSISGEGHYEIAHTALEFAKSLGVKQVITIGGFVTEQPSKVVGAVSEKSLLNKYKKFNITFGKSHPVGTIVGASGLFCGMAKDYKMDGICLMGETIGFPLITDPKAADRVLQTLKSMLKLNVDLKKLEKAVKEMNEQIKKTEHIHRKMLEDTSKPESKEQMKYIG